MDEIAGQLTVSLHVKKADRAATHLDIFFSPAGSTDPLVSLQCPRPGLRLFLQGQAVELVAVAPHRRHYLGYRGKISGGRGRVRPLLHLTARITRDENLGGFSGRLTADRLYLSSSAFSHCSGGKLN